MVKNLRKKCGQKLLDKAKQYTTDVLLQIASKRAIQKTAEATGDSIGNKIADKITSLSKRSPTELHSKELQNDEMKEPKKRDTFLQKKGNKLLIN